MEKPVAI